MIYKILISEKNLADFSNTQLLDIKHKFLYNSLSQDIKVSGDLNSSTYLFFDSIAIKINSSEKKEEELEKSNNENLYFAYYFDEEISNEEISKILRNSSTLDVTHSNCFENKNMKVVFAENGFLLCKKIKEKDLTATFERILFLFLLAISYNTYSEVLINKVTQSFIQQNFEQMIKIRDDIYSFDVRCFFHNPIKINRHETFKLWNLISSNYYVKIKYEEMKSQITELANIIELKQQKIKEDKNKKFERLIAIIGIVLAATSLLGFYSDLKDLGLFR